MEIETITASHSRKINHSLYGGEQYEGSDHFCSMTASVETEEDLKEAHRELFLACKEMTGVSVANEILKLQGGKPWGEFMAQLREYRLGELELADDVYHSWNQQQKNVYEEMKKLKRTK